MGKYVPRPLNERHACLLEKASDKKGLDPAECDKRFLRTLKNRGLVQPVKSGNLRITREGKKALAQLKE